MYDGSSKEWAATLSLINLLPILNTGVPTSSYVNINYASLLSQYTIAQWPIVSGSLFPLAEAGISLNSFQLIQVTQDLLSQGYSLGSIYPIIQAINNYLSGELPLPVLMNTLPQPQPPTAPPSECEYDLSQGASSMNS